MSLISVEASELMHGHGTDQRPNLIKRSGPRSYGICFRHSSSEPFCAECDGSVSMRLSLLCDPSHQIGLEYSFEGSRPPPPPPPPPPPALRFGTSITPFSGTTWF